MYVQAVELLMDLTGDGDEAVRINISKALDTIALDADRVIPAMVGLLGIRTAKFATNVAYSLAPFGQAAEPAVELLLAKPKGGEPLCPHSQRLGDFALVSYY